MDMPRDRPATARAAEAVAAAPGGDVPRRRIDRDVPDVPGRHAAFAEQESDRGVTAYRQQLTRPECHRARAAAGVPRPPNIGAPEARADEGSIAQTIGRRVQLACPEAAR